MFNPTSASLADVITKKGYKKIAILGGAQTYNYFLEQRLITDLYLTIEPVAFGDGVSIFSSLQDNNVMFQLKESRKLNGQGTILLHYILNL